MDEKDLYVLTWGELQNTMVSETSDDMERYGAVYTVGYLVCNKVGDLFICACICLQHPRRECSSSADGGGGRMQKSGRDFSGHIMSRAC